MDAHYVICHNGVFFIPETVRRSLAALVKHGFVYLRQDVDTLTISATRIEGGHRRALNVRFRATMFRNATRLAVMNLNGAVQVMAVT